MPGIICKLVHEGKAIYFEWSPIVDGSLTPGMSLADFTEYYKAEYGNASMNSPFHDGFAARMKRVEERGTSSMTHDNAEDVISLNHAGPNGERATPAEVVAALVQRVR